MASYQPLLNACATCGAAQPPAARFCAHCGTPIASAYAPDVEKEKGGFPGAAAAATHAPAAAAAASFQPSAPPADALPPSYQSVMVPPPQPYPPPAAAALQQPHHPHHHPHAHSGHPKYPAYPPAFQAPAFHAPARPHAPVVIQHQPLGGTTLVMIGNPWRKRMCDCMDLGLGTCLYALLCPRCALADARARMDSSEWCFNCCCVSVPAMTSIVRQGYRIDGSDCDDCWAAECCPHLTVCQLMNETKVRGPKSPGAFMPNVHEWSFDLFDCCGDFSTFCLACVSPQLAGAQARADYDQSDSCFNCCCVPLCVTRNLVRHAYNIKGDWVSDVCASVCCAACVANQLLREVKAKTSSGMVRIRLDED